MASTPEFLAFVLEQLSELDGVSYRAMMGEYILYYHGKVVGGIYDDRFLVKPTPGAQALMPNAQQAMPYAGAKPMLAVDNIEDKAFLAALLRTVEAELPSPRRK